MFANQKGKELLGFTKERVKDEIKCIIYFKIPKLTTRQKSRKSTFV